METKLQQLTVDERIKLVEDLWDSIAADQGALPTDAVCDIRRRLQPQRSGFVRKPNRTWPTRPCI